jgi:hypothetical protein
LRGDGDMREVRVEADLRLRATDRAAFFGAVASGTVEELVRLGRRSEALAVVRRFLPEVGLGRAVALAGRCLVRR